MITDRINNNLSALYNIEDPIYKALICQTDPGSEAGIFGTAKFGTAVFGTLKPIRNDIGAIASQLEYLREAGIYFLDQIYIDKADNEFLKFQLETFFNSFNLENETDTEWIQRTFTKVFQQKVSKASIIYAMRPYSSEEPIIENVIEESAYADFFFADVYIEDEVEFEGDTVYVLPAIFESDISSSFTIRIILHDTASEDLFTVQNILNDIIAAGIIYILQIDYT